MIGWKSILFSSASAIALLLSGSSKRAESQTVTVNAALTSPAYNGQVFRQLVGCPNVTISGNNYKILITGGTPNGNISVSWNMFLKVDRASIVPNDAGAIQAPLDGTGSWSYLGWGTGSASNTSVYSQGSYIYPGAQASTNCTVGTVAYSITDTRTFYVVCNS